MLNPEFLSKKTCHGKYFGLRMLDKFRTANWTRIKSDLQFSGIITQFSQLSLQN
jgi:hypothetical protein